MERNPYEPPRSPGERHQRPRRLGCGNLVFVGLGLVFVLLPTGALASAYSDPRTPANVLSGMTLGAVPMIALGILLVVHGLVRSDASIGIVVSVLCTCMLIIALVVALV